MVTELEWNIFVSIWKIKFLSDVKECCNWRDIELALLDAEVRVSKIYSGELSVESSLSLRKYI